MFPVATAFQCEERRLSTGYRGLTDRRGASEKAPAPVPRPAAATAGLARAAAVCRGLRRCSTTLKQPPHHCQKTVRSSQFRRRMLTAQRVSRGSFVHNPQETVQNFLECATTGDVVKVEDEQAILTADRVDPPRTCRYADAGCLTEPLCLVRKRTKAISKLGLNIVDMPRL